MVTCPSGHQQSWGLRPSPQAPRPALTLLRVLLRVSLWYFWFSRLAIVWMKLNESAVSQPFFHLPWGISCAFLFSLQVESALGFYPMHLGQTLSLAPGERGGSPAMGCKMWAACCSSRAEVLCSLDSR